MIVSQNVINGFSFSVLQKGYDDLQSIVPTCQQQSEFAVGAQKISKATVLQKSKMWCFWMNTPRSSMWLMDVFEIVVMG